ncbi:hypothetical protein [Rhizobium sp. NFR03]|uniref:hypothetical protein n=1 Tax=Rhizobium sp. NFR03 TaxID=1566263 RepID=UPI0008AEF2C3|nr:hypothetical protein [Rhizobium sp. NFR03]SES47248.1 hypothetical protein SAMN03159406_04957 [Rhizobium sp. NFR03]
MTEPVPGRLVELSEDTRSWLADLREDELKTLKEVVKMPADDVRDGFKMVRDLRTVTRFLRWLIYGALAIFLGTVALYKNVLEIWGWIKGVPSA